MSRATIRWSDHGSFAVVPEWILDADISDRAVRLFAVLGRYANDASLAAMPTRKTLASRLRCAASTLDDALRELRGIGALTWSARRRDDGGQGANEYVLHPTPLSTERHPPTDGAVAPPTDGAVGQEREHVRTRGERTASSPSLVKIEGRNLGFDALAEVCQVDVRNKTRVGELTRALKDIRQYVASDTSTEGEPFERAVAAQIVAKAANYRTTMRGATLTPSALAKWWHDLEAVGALRGPSAADFDDVPDFDD